MVVFVLLLAVAVNSILLIHVSCLPGFEHFEYWQWGLQGDAPAVCEGETSIAFILGLPDPWTLAFPVLILAAALTMLLLGRKPRA